MRARWPLLALLTACPAPGPEVPATGLAETPVDALAKRFAYVPPQCYTRTNNTPERTFNPCYTCHTTGRRPNFIDDSELQEAYTFRSATLLENPWRNLFVDRTDAVSAISDAEVRAHVDTDNYRSGDELLLRTRLTDALLPAWDADADGAWGGYLPDCWFSFDEDGFDRGPDGRQTGWRAFRYAPFPGTFWPTNGSFDDVLIRLPPAYRQDASGRPDQQVSIVNHAIVEALIQEGDVDIAPVDERSLGADLDKDGELGTATVVRYDWAPREGRHMSYVGQAQGEPVAAGFYPVGTEFLHSVRYLGVDSSGQVGFGTRMKELRYARKQAWMTYFDARLYASALDREPLEDDVEPKLFLGDVESGLRAGNGWVYQGFIEDAQGELRPQTVQETTFCMGCHSTIGATTDSTFAFPRKYAEQGWLHWTQRDLSNVPDSGEYARYLRLNGAGDELRANTEVQTRFFDPDGLPREEAWTTLERDVSSLLLPSSDRALELNKAYWTLVQEQSFTDGRDPSIRPAKNVHERLILDQPTGLTRVDRLGTESRY